MLLKQRGTALITALFIIALVTAIAVAQMARLSRDIRRTALLLNSTQAQLYTEGSLAWAMDSLRSNALHQKPQEPIDKIPLVSTQNLPQHYSCSSTLGDAQAYFNLNNLVNEEWFPEFERLLSLIEPSLLPETRHQLTLSIAHWISPLRTNIENDMYYSKLPHPYRAPHRPMASVSELTLIRGIPADLYQKLLPFVTALPLNTPINVNTAPLILLQSLNSTLTPEDAKILTLLRSQKPFGTIELFLNTELVRNHPISPYKVTVNSQYFMLETQVEKKGQRLILHSMLQRGVENSKPVVVLWQKKQ